MVTHDLTIPRNPPMSEFKRHMVKCWPDFFAVLWNGTKTFEVRLNDRDYGVGDVIALHEYYPDKRCYTGRFLERRIVYVTNFLLREGYVVLQLAV